MNVEVLNTGTELLIGNVTNTHLAYFGQQLFPLGLRISRQTTIPDGAAIREALVDAFSRCDVLLVTGGLGPTTDDVTREITAELLGFASGDQRDGCQLKSESGSREGASFCASACFVRQWFLKALLCSRMLMALPPGFTCLPF